MLLTIVLLCFLSPAAPEAQDGRYSNAPHPSVTFSFRTVTWKCIDIFSHLLSLKNLPKHLRFCFIPIYLNDCQTDIGRPTIASRQIHWPPLRMRWRMATRKHIPKQIQFNFGSHDAKTYNIAFGCQTILNIIFVILGLVQLVQIFIRSAGIV